MSTSGWRSRAVAHVKRLYSLCHFTKVGPSVFYCSWPVFIQLLVKNSSDECFPVSLGNIFLCSTRTFLVACTLLQFKPFIFTCSTRILGTDYFAADLLMFENCYYVSFFLLKLCSFTLILAPGFCGTIAKAVKYCLTVE